MIILATTHMKSQAFAFLDLAWRGPVRGSCSNWRRSQQFRVEEATQLKSLWGRMHPYSFERGSYRGSISGLYRVYVGTARSLADIVAAFQCLAKRGWKKTHDWQVLATSQTSPQLEAYKQWSRKSLQYDMFTVKRKGRWN